MKKIDKHNLLILRRKRERKRLKRLNNRHLYHNKYLVVDKVNAVLEKKDFLLIDKFESPLYKFLKSEGFIKNDVKTTKKIIIPKDFSFQNNYVELINILKIFTATVFKRRREVIIDFTNCKFVDQPALFILQILRLSYLEDIEKLSKKLSILSVKVVITILKSENEEVNKLLLINGLLSEAQLNKNGLMPITTMGYFKGTKNQKHYADNQKGLICTRIVNYLDDCVSHHDYCFTPEGKNDFDGLISEILSNAEDHSPMNTYYVTANFLSEIGTDDGEAVGEVNLSFMNFGYSIFKGFEDSKEKNLDTYSVMEEMCERLSNNYQISFTKENLFTLYAIQDGISRLKYEDESRGTGTIKFINSFFAFGDYEDFEKHYHPEMSILSGSTHIICNNKYKPELKNDIFVISLNAENDLMVPPDEECLKTVSHFFPGTLLFVRIYLNKQHITKKLDSSAS